MERFSRALIRIMRNFDEHTGEELDPELVHKAMMEELSYFNDNEVWHAAEYGQMKAVEDHTFVRTRWVLCNKGDAAAPDVKACLRNCKGEATIVLCIHPTIGIQEVAMLAICN